MVIGMAKIIDAWDCTKQGDFILTLGEKIPCGVFNKCRIANKEYSLVPTHLFGVSPNALLRHIGIKAPKESDFKGKDVEF